MERLTLRRLWAALDAAGIDTSAGSVEAPADRRGAREGVTPPSVLRVNDPWGV